MIEIYNMFNENKMDFYWDNPALTGLLIRGH